MTREENLYWLNKEIELWENECQSKHPIKEALYAARKALEQGPYKDTIDRQAAIRIASGYCHPANIADELAKLPSAQPKPKMGRWMRKTKVDGVYDIAGVKTWGVKCQCDKCDFATTVIENFGYYNYCPNCGAKMVEPQKSEVDE